jgi:copper transport protein
VRRVLALALAGLAALLALPAVASAHAQLEGTVPQRGAVLEHVPGQVVFRFDESVEAGLGAVHVFDAKGRRVESGGVFHPGGDGKRVAVRLPSSLPHGGYTATYRVISADSHPVSGGFSFSIGHGGAGAQSVDRLLQGTSAGPVTTTALAATRAVQFAAITLALGVVAFLLLCWLPALRDLAGASGRWAAASQAFSARTSTLLLVAAAVGVVASVVGILLQGAVAEGASLWSSLKGSVISDVLGTRFGTTWGLAVVAWALVLGLSRLSATRAPALQPASLGADGIAMPGSRNLALLAVPVAALCLLPAFSGHPSVEAPTWIMLPSNVLHVVAIGGWIGGVAVMVVALRTATGALATEDRAPLLAAVVGRFSRWAGVAVAVVLATGIAQSLVAINAWSELLHTAYGRSVLIKIALFALLLGFGWVNRNRILPALRGATTPGRAGVLLRRTLRLELAVAIAVLGVTGALSTYPPGDAEASGPASVTAVIGPARLQATVDPARVGPNEVHLYLFDRRSGAQWDKAKELTATASLPEKGIDNLPLPLHRGGPGHYIGSGVTFGVAGHWMIRITARVSDFDQFEKTVMVHVQ